jgi:serine beta-lactamase-like protein LACTB, mitochondrial
MYEVSRSEGLVGCRLLAALVLCAIAAASACGASESSPASNAAGCRETTASADHRHAIAIARPLLRRLNAGLRAPGLSLTVAAGGRIVWSANCGYADLKSRRPVTDRTRFRIGSVSKPLTATALARVAASGQVDLDASVARYLPEFPSHGGAITLRRLAGHLAGIRHYETQAEAINRRHFANVAATLSLFADDPLVAEPGARFSYSSYGYDVIGAVLEHVAGKSFAALMREQVLAPASMTATTLASAPANARATFYEVTSNGGVRRAPPIDLSDRLPAGGFLSTAGDLARFGVALTDGTLVDAAAAQMMFTSQRTTTGESTGYGLGFEVHPSPFGLFVGHTGAVDGGTAALLIHPQSRAVLALTTNLGYASAPTAPPPKNGTPDPPTLLLPFIRK